MSTLGPSAHDDCPKWFGSARVFPQWTACGTDDRYEAAFSEAKITNLRGPSSDPFCDCSVGRVGLSAGLDAQFVIPFETIQTVFESMLGPGE